jgi:hypothetical protein
MGRLIGLDLSVIAEAVEPDLLAIAEEIASEVADEYPTVEAHPTATGAAVWTHGSFDHLREWGSVNNAPRGRMRSAAAKRGDFKPEGK